MEKDALSNYIFFCKIFTYDYQKGLKTHCGRVSLYLGPLRRDNFRWMGATPFDIWQRCHLLHQHV